MSRKSHRPESAPGPTREAAFAALGDATRLSLVQRLAAGGAASIADLSEGAQMTRQAITKHLRVLERAGIVRSRRSGRETRFALQRRPLHDLEIYLERVSRQWDEALGRLKALVEK